MSTMTVGVGESLAEAIRRCREEQRRWAALRMRDRLRTVKALRSLLVEECDRVCEVLARDVGKSTAEGLGEVLSLADACKFLEREAASLLSPRKVPRRTRPVWFLRQKDWVHRRPRGVVGIIGTWNYPVLLNGTQIVQALTAGNAVAWKPSEVAPATAELLTDLFRRAGFPEGLLHILPATREGGPALLEADVDHVVFTGSAAVGRHIATRLGQRLISSTLELSGCDAMYVLPDADVNLAATAAWFGATANRGQTCIAVRRAFVHRTVYQPFVEALRPRAEAATPLPLALASQARQAERLVGDALEKGGRLLGPAAESNGEAAFRPTVVLDATADMELWREASFAPLLAVLPYDDLDDAVKQDALCPFGLGASVFTRYPRQAEALAGLLRTGMVTVNDVIVPTAHPGSPFGGLRESGWGVTQGAEGLLEMTVPQVVSVKGGSYRPHYELAAGATGNQEGLLRGVLRFCHGRSLLERWRGFWKMIRGG